MPFGSQKTPLDPAFKTRPPRPPGDKTRDYILGFGRLKGDLWWTNGRPKIRAGETREIVAGPTSIRMQPQRIYLPDNLAPHFSVLDVKIGYEGREESRLVGRLAKPQPASAFGEKDAYWLDLGDCRVCHQIVLVVKNESSEELVFVGAIMGPEVLLPGEKRDPPLFDRRTDLLSDIDDIELPFTD